MVGKAGWQRRVAGLVALLVPLVTLVLGWQRLDRPPEPTGKAAAMDRNLRHGPDPEIVVLGSSLARTNVRLDVLSEEVGVPEDHIVLLTLPNATAAHWYAILENRIFAAGYEPKVVLIVGALTTMVTPDLLMEANVERLVNQLSEDEPVIGRKVFGTADSEEFRWLYRREQAGQVRDRLVERWRDLALSFVFRGTGKASAGAKLAARANEAVFADDRMDYALHRAQPTGLSVDAVEALDLSDLDVAHESLLPDLSALAAAHHTKIVFVRTPFPPSNLGNDFVPPDVEAAAKDLLADTGSVYVDLRSLNLDDSYFRDMRHMSKEGAAIFTRALAATMRELGLLRKGAAAIGRVSLEPAAFTRLPAAPGALVQAGAPVALSSCAWRFDVPGLGAIADTALAAVGRADASPVRVAIRGQPLAHVAVDPLRCTPGFSVTARGVVVGAPPGTSPSDVVIGLDPSWTPKGTPLGATWVFPGSSVRWTFDDRWEMPAQAFEVLVVGHALGEGDGLEVRVDGVALPIARDGVRARTAVRPVLPKGAPWTLEIASPPGGPWLLLQNVRLGRSPYTSDLVGLPELLAGASIRVVGGKVEDTNLEPTFLTPVRPVGTGLVPRSAARGVAAFALPGYALLADAPNTHAGNPHKCSPFRVLEDGVPLLDDESTCEEMAKLRGGRSCHAGDRLYFTSSDSTDPSKNGRSYTLALDRARSCDRRNQKDTTPLRGSLWLYPGDHVVLDFPNEALEGFLDGANQLEVALDPIVHATGGSDVLVRLSQGGAVVFEERITDGGRRREYHKKLLETALAPRAQDVRLELINEDPEAWWLLVMATLSESYDHDVVAAEAPADVRPPDRLARVGQIAKLPKPSKARPLEGGAVELQLAQLSPISNAALERAGFGWWGPLRLAEGGTAIAPAPDRDAFQSGRCDPCFLHAGRAIVARPADPTGAGLVATLDPDLPSKTPGGDEVLWVYPGTSTVLGFDTPWSGGQAKVRVDVAAFAPGRKGDIAPPRLRVAGIERTFVGQAGAWEAVVTVPRAGEGPWDVEIVAPADGAWLLVSEVDVEDADGTRTAWRVPRRTSTASAD